LKKPYLALKKLEPAKNVKIVAGKNAQVPLGEKKETYELGWTS